MPANNSGTWGSRPRLSKSSELDRGLLARQLAELRFAGQPRAAVPRGPLILSAFAAFWLECRILHPFGASRPCQYSFTASSFAFPAKSRPRIPCIPLKSAPIAAFGGVAVDLQHICWIGAHCGAMLRNTRCRVNSWAISGCGRTRSGLPRIHVSCSSARLIGKRWPHWSTGSIVTSDSRYW